MQKRGLLSILILIASISFTSAQSFGIGELLDAFGGENILLIGSFILSFVLINFILGRVPAFKDKVTGKTNKAIPGVIALILSLFIIYGINRFDFDLVNFFSGFGVEQELLELIAIILVLAGLVYLLYKFKSWVILIAGIILFGLSLTDLFFEKGIIMVAGIALIVLWILIKIFKRKKKLDAYNPSGIDDVDRQERERREQEYKKAMKQQTLTTKQEKAWRNQQVKQQKIAVKEVARKLKQKKKYESTPRPRHEAEQVRAAAERLKAMRTAKRQKGVEHLKAQLIEQKKAFNQTSKEYKNYLGYYQKLNKKELMKTEEGKNHLKEINKKVKESYQLMALIGKDTQKMINEIQRLS